MLNKNKDQNHRVMNTDERLVSGQADKHVWRAMRLGLWTGAYATESK